MTSHNEKLHGKVQFSQITYLMMCYQHERAFTRFNEKSNGYEWLLFIQENEIEFFLIHLSHRINVFDKVSCAYLSMHGTCKTLNIMYIAASREVCASLHYLIAGRPNRL